MNIGRKRCPGRGAKVGFIFHVINSAGLSGPDKGNPRGGIVINREQSHLGRSDDIGGARSWSSHRDDGGSAIWKAAFAHIIGLPRKRDGVESASVRIKQSDCLAAGTEAEIDMQLPAGPVLAALLVGPEEHGA